MGKVKTAKNISNGNGASTSAVTQSSKKKKSSGVKKASLKAKTSTTPRGKPKSGRVWKNLIVKDRASSVRKSKRLTIDKQMAIREEAKKVKELSDALKNAKKAEAEERNKRIAANKRKKEENAKKSEIVQIIKNPAKLKRMKKKQLRKIEKRDTTMMAKK